MKIPSSALKAALDVRQLDGILGEEEASAETVLHAALIRYERDVIARIADQAVAHANILRAEKPGEPMDPAWVLGWFADELRKGLPAENKHGNYSPADGDVVELVLTGEVRRYSVRLTNGEEGVTWDLVTEQGISIPMNEDDFRELRVTRLVAGGE